MLVSCHLHLHLVVSVGCWLLLAVAVAVAVVLLRISYLYCARAPPVSCVSVVCDRVLLHVLSLNCVCVSLCLLVVCPVSCPCPRAGAALKWMFTELAFSHSVSTPHTPGPADPCTLLRLRLLMLHSFGIPVSIATTGTSTTAGTSSLRSHIETSTQGGAATGTATAGHGV